MPRLPWRLLARAWTEDPYLPLILRTCRDLQSARLELRWLKEHSQTVVQKSGATLRWKSLLHQLCSRRSRGVPLQYLLGTEFFGELELQCRPGVLIPRPDTAAYVQHLAELLGKHATSLPDRFQILDLCTGSGCIPILLTHYLSKHLAGRCALDVVGVDISSKAIRLADTNLREQQNLYPNSGLQQVSFARADILSTTINSHPPSLEELLKAKGQKKFDILISNPPYISPKHFYSSTARSVRNHEPKLALVPHAPESLPDNEHGDLFYPRLLEVATSLQVKLLVMEVGGLEQALRVASLARTFEYWGGVEIWCDEMEGGEVEEVERCVIRGKGNGRVVVCWRVEARGWLGR